ncbi:hypothetical protein BSL82_02605 [Tardibacter chloracetimidivorans]|uniref:AB hydrolase-1 domain-containing protein n=1 Tax=Tardibacter chloracetimidivorans TaxID=1921510 RepID=A0A1L3ZRT7_9SPHN|nr:alpha/beta hydrolase [Tardibacter chloracetimidivorans]API58335.1 hypothetical protein BSL82_02605 [Tardibacter chloracetimidivorans]
MFRFVHGWGFDAALWDAMRATLGGDASDLGYFGELREFGDDGRPFVAVGHSLAALLWLKALPPNCAGLVAINGFDRFAGEPGDPTAVPRRMVERMIARFRERPAQVLVDFRERCGAERPVTATLQTERLLQELEVLRDTDAREAARRLHCPVLVLHGNEDAILPPAMREAVFSGSRHVKRHALSGHGHLLPLTAPEWCAEHVRAFAQRLPGLVS